MTSMPEIDPLIGLDLGGYVVSRLMASGGMGLVYEARHPAIGRRAAVKVLKPELAADTQWSARFLTEARAIAALNHRNIVEILNFGQTPDGRQFMMMAFLDGESLESLVARAAPLPPALALNLAEQVLNGLAEAHKKGVVHRDLKPSNVWLVKEHSGELLVKLLDFGLARQDPVNLGESMLMQRAQAGTSILAGTPEYIAPEQALGEAVNASADLYALGVVLFEMLAGHLPFQSQSVGELLNLHVNQPPPDLDDLVANLPAGVSAFVDGLLQKDPARRPGSADLARQQVQRLLKRLTMDATMMRAPIEPTGLPGDDIGVGQTVRLERPMAVVQSTDKVSRQARPTTAQALEAAFPPRKPVATWVGGGVALALVVGGGVWWAARSPVQAATHAGPTPAVSARPPEGSPTAAVVPRGPQPEEGLTVGAPGKADAPAPAAPERPRAAEEASVHEAPRAVTPPPQPPALAHAPPTPSPVPNAPRPTSASAAVACVPDAQWRANLRQDLADLGDLAAKDAALFQTVHAQTETLSRAVQAASTTEHCVNAERAVEALRKKVTGQR